MYLKLDQGILALHQVDRFLSSQQAGMTCNLIDPAESSKFEPCYIAGNALGNQEGFAATVKLVSIRWYGGQRST